MKFLHTADWQIGMKAMRVGKAGSKIREVRIVDVSILLCEESQKGFKRRDQLMRVHFLLGLMVCIILFACGDRETESEQTSVSKIGDLVNTFVTEGNEHRETNLEPDTMPPVIPHPDSHHVEWSWSLISPALRDLIDIGEPAVPYLLEEHMNIDRENKPFTVKSAGWAIIHIGEPALPYIENAMKMGSEGKRWAFTIMISAIADTSKSEKAVDMLKALQKDESEKVRDIANDIVAERQE